MFKVRTLMGVAQRLRRTELTIQINQSLA